MVSRKYDMSKKTTIITGAAGLLGYQHAIAILESNSRVILTDLNFKKLINIKKLLQNKYNKNNIFIKKMDVTDEKEVKSTCDFYLSKGIKVNVLINNAAINPKMLDKRGNYSSRLEFFSLKDWNREINVGLTGALICSKVFGYNMVKNKIKGVILNIASDLSVIAPDQRIYMKKGLLSSEQPVKPVTYSVIKTGLVGLTKYIATYWAQHGIRANSLSPGGVFENQNEEFLEKVKQCIPVNRMANIDEYNAAIQFLCSDASSYMNGQNIVIDGGRSVW